MARLTQFESSWTSACFQTGLEIQAGSYTDTARWAWYMICQLTSDPRPRKTQASVTFGPKGGEWHWTQLRTAPNQHSHGDSNSGRLCLNIQTFEKQLLPHLLSQVWWSERGHCGERGQRARHLISYHTDKMEDTCFILADDKHSERAWGIWGF